MNWRCGLISGIVAGCLAFVLCSLLLGLCALFVTSMPIDIIGAGAIGCAAGTGTINFLFGLCH